MGFSSKFANVRLILFVCFICAFLFATFLNSKITAQQQTTSNANANSSTNTAPTPTQQPTPIGLLFIIIEKERIEKRLQEIQKRISERSIVSQTQAELANLISNLDSQEQKTKALINDNPSLEALDKAEESWTEGKDLLSSRKTRLEAQAAEISNQTAELQNILSVWEQTKREIDNVVKQPAGETVSADAASSNTNQANSNNNKTSTGGNTSLANNIVNPPVAANERVENSTPQNGRELTENIKQRVSEVIDKIKQTQSLLGAQLSELFKLQERISETEKRIDNTLGAIATARNSLLANLVIKDSPAIWDAGEQQTNLRHEIQQSFSEKFAVLRDYLRQHPGHFIFHLLVILALILAFHRAKRKTHQLVEQDPQLKPGLIIFEHPLASALVLGLFFAPFFYPQPPELLGEIISPFLMLAILFLFRHLIEKSYLPILIGIVALYVINDLRLLTASLPFLSRLIFLAQMLGGIVFLVWLIRSMMLEENISGSIPLRYKAIKWTSIFLLLPFALAFLANAFGYVSLAGVVGKTIVSALVWGLVLYALAQVFKSLLIFVSRIPPFSKLMMVERHRQLIQTKIFKIINWVAVLFWLFFTLYFLYLVPPFLAFLQYILAAEIKIGTVSLSLDSILTVIIIIWGSFLVSRLLRFVLEEDVYPRVHLAEGLPYATSTILHYLLLLGGVLFALSAAGIDLTQFTIFLGALGVGIGIGLQNIVENFTSGLILLLERPVKVGDSIQMKQHQGVLKQIGLRASVVRTFDGADIIVPNGHLITEEVTNWNLSASDRRIDVDVGVEYGTDPEIVIKLLAEVGHNHPDSDPEHKPLALFLGFGDNALNFQLRVWTKNQDGWLVIKSDLGVGIYKTLSEAGIQILFPQRDLHLKSVDDKLLSRMNLINNEKPKQNVKNHPK